MSAYDETLLIVPKNDEESLMIYKIATAAGIPTLVSEQPHGARLEREKDLVARIRAANPHALLVTIVEIPGPEVEENLRGEGFTVEIIDHHRYDNLDRMRDASSLEQFLATFGLEDTDLLGLGFDPALVRGVGIIDRGFLWALRTEVPDKVEQKRIRDYYRSLTLELGKDRAAIEATAKAAWDAREVVDGIIVVWSTKKDVGIRDAISFLIADNFDTPQTAVIIEGDRRLFVQESDASADLFQAYGGFTFGRDRCWGIQATPEKPLPALQDVILELTK